VKPGGQSVASTHVSPGVWHFWKLHTWPAPQHASAHTSAASQQTPPAQMPPLPQGDPG
jgi:hypothetical protein